MREQHPKPTFDEQSWTNTILRSFIAYRKGIGLFSHIPELPEARFITNIQQVAREVGKEDLPLNAWAQTGYLLFRDDTVKQLRRMQRIEDMREHWQIFDPQSVLDMDANELNAHITQYIKPNGNAKAVAKWEHNAEVILRSGGLQSYFDDRNRDAGIILQDMIGPERKTNPKTGEEHEGFHRYGLKTGVLTLLVAEHHGLASLDNMAAIGLPIDFQVTRLAVQTEALKFGSSYADRKYIQHKLMWPHSVRFLTETGFTGHDISQALYLLGNYGCNKNRHELCPVKNECTMKISRDSYDTHGRISFEDVGKDTLQPNDEDEEYIGPTISEMMAQAQEIVSSEYIPPQIPPVYREPVLAS